MAVPGTPEPAQDDYAPGLRYIPRRVRIFRALAWGLGIGLGVVLLAVVLIIGPFFDPVARWAVARFIPWQGASVEVGSIARRGLHGLTLTGVRIAPDSAGDVMQLDSLQVDFSLGDLILGKPRSVEAITVAGLRVEAAQTDSGWAWMEPFTVDTTVPAQPAGPGFAIGRIVVRNSSVRATSRDGQPFFSADSIAAEATGLVLDTAPAVELVRARMRIQHAGTGSGWMGLAVRGGFSGGQLRVDTLVVTDTSSGQALARGTIQLDEGKPPQFDLGVFADKLHLSQLHPLVADYVAATQTVDGEITLRGAANLPGIDAVLRFNGAGAVRANTTITLEPDTTAFDIRATIDALDIERISGGRFALDPINGRVDGRLNVTEPDSISGPLTLDLRSSAAGQPVRLSGRADLTGGLAAVAMDAEYREYRAAIRGTIRPADTTSYDLEANLRTEVPLPEAIAMRIPSAKGPWDVVVHARGAGVTPADAGAVVTGRFNTVDKTGSGTLDARIADGRATANAHLELDGAMVDARGQAALDAPATSWRVDRLDVRNAALAPWLESAAPGRLYASVSAAPRGQVIEGVAQIDSVSGGQLDGLAARLEFTMEGTTTRVTGRATQDGATVVIDTLRLRGAIPERAAIAFTRVDPSTFDTTLASGSINGRVVLEPAPGTFDSTITDIRDARLVGRLVLDSSTYNGRPLQGEADVRYLAGSLHFDARFASVEQTIVARGQADTRTEPLEIRIEKAELRKIDPAFWSAGRLPAGVLNADVAGTLRGRDLRGAIADATVTLDSTRLGGFALARAELALALRDGRATLGGTASNAEVRARLDAEASMGNGGAWQGGGRLILADTLSQSRDSLPIQFTFASPDTVARTGWQAAFTGNGKIVGLRVDTLDVAIGYVDPTLTVTRLVMVGPDITVHGAGSVPLRIAPESKADLSINAEVPGLGFVLALAGFPGYRGRATLALRSTGTGPSVQHQLVVGGGNLRGSGVEVDSLVATLTANSDSSALLSDLTIDAQVSGKRPLLFSPAGSPFLIGLGDGTTARGDATGAALKAAWKGADKTLQVTQLDLRLGGEDWSLARPVAVVVGGAIEIRGLDVSSPDSSGHLRVAGIIDRDGEQNLTVSILQLPVQMHQQGAVGDLGGRLDLEGALTGPAAAPRLALKGQVLGARGEAHRTSVDLEWTAERLRLQVQHPGERGGEVDIGGTFPLGLTLVAGKPPVGFTEGQVDFRVNFREFDLATLKDGLDQNMVERLGGRLTSDLHVTGATSAPEFSGQMSVAAFSLKLGSLGTSLTSERLVASLAGRRLTITEGNLIGEKKGTLRLAGGLDFTDLTKGTFDLTAAFDKFRVVNYAKTDATITGQLAVNGSFAEPVLKGDVRVVQGNYQVTAEDMAGSYTEVQLTEADYREVERRFGVSREAAEASSVRFWNALKLDVNVRMVTDVWVRRSYEPGLAVELAGTLRVQKEPAQALQAVGEVSVVEGRSYIEEFGRRFTISRGIARFDGPIGDVEVEGQATYEPDEDVTIRMDIRGDAKGFSLSLSSEPAMSETDIVYYIATGRPASDASAFGESGALRDVGTGVALSRVSAGVTDAARRSFGLDVVEIRQDGVRGIVLVAGRYLSRLFYVGFSQPVTNQGQQEASGTVTTEIDAEYRASKWLLLNLSGSTQLARFFLKSKYAY